MWEPNKWDPHIIKSYILRKSWKFLCLNHAVYLLHNFYHNSPYDELWVVKNKSWTHMDPYFHHSQLTKEWVMAKVVSFALLVMLRLRCIKNFRHKLYSLMCLFYIQNKTKTKLRNYLVCFLYDINNINYHVSCFSKSKYISFHIKKIYKIMIRKLS